MRYTWGRAIQGASGLWFKPGIDDAGHKHLLVSEEREGIEHGSHDHYWDNNDGTYGMQLRDQTDSAVVCDARGHIYPRNTTFPSFANQYLQELFARSEWFS